jgi:hypothetical protein
MKKKFLWLAFILLVSDAGFAAFFSVIKQTKETLVSKTVSFSLYKGSNYKSGVYNKSSAQIDIVIEKVGDKKRTKIWDTTLDAKLLNKYPVFKKAISKTVIIPEIYAGSERLEITYFIIYNSNGSILTMPGEDIFFTNKNIEIIL